MLNYNANNIQDRARLASEVLNVLVSWGFSIDQELSNNTWEFVCSRKDKFDDRKKIIVYTSIEKLTGAMRKDERDRIKVLRSSLIEGRTHFVRVSRIVSRGNFNQITARVCDGIVKAQKSLSNTLKRY